MLPPRVGRFSARPPALLRPPTPSRLPLLATPPPSFPRALIISPLHRPLFRFPVLSAHCPFPTFSPLSQCLSPSSSHHGLSPTAPPTRARGCSLSPCCFVPSSSSSSSSSPVHSFSTHSQPSPQTPESPNLKPQDSHPHVDPNPPSIPSAHPDWLTRLLLSRDWLLPAANATPHFTQVLLGPTLRHASHRVDPPEATNGGWVDPTGATPGTWVDPSPDLPAGSIRTVDVIRDDLIHPLAGGNKLRKLDGLLPPVIQSGATDVVTCGGCQSAHAAAVAVACAERGIKAHLVLRGEPPKVLTGNALVSHMFGCPKYVSRAEYADREKSLLSRAAAVAGGGGTVQWGAGPATSSTSIATSAAEDATSGLRGKSDGCGSGEKGHESAEGVHESAAGHPRVAIIPEGGSDGLALLGLLRLVHLLAVRDRQGANQGHNRQQRRRVLVVDSGTGTTAVGCALAVRLLGLPWLVVGVMLAGTKEYYTGQQEKLLRSFADQLPSQLSEPPLPVAAATAAAGPAAREGSQGRVQGQQGAKGVGDQETEAVEEAAALKQLSADVRSQAKPIQEQLSACSPHLPLAWVPRETPRRFGKILPGEVSLSCDFMRATGIPIDPIYTLAAWEVACALPHALTQALALAPGSRGEAAGEEQMYLEVAHALPHTLAQAQALAPGNRGKAAGKKQQGQSESFTLSLAEALLPKLGQWLGSSNKEGSSGEAAGSGSCIANDAGSADSGGGDGADAAADIADISITVLHTGGTLDMFGLAQRFPEEFAPMK
ncbi:hypothetical protein CLOM_g2899 [Closterium sp. NIES-68]|nr:hypothetical protein CLOM_g2899 [Closterium sp. NIES-68]GJP79087.1 hypothetical protein CLOP_g9331 [Closterium sp. NIES-67]